MCEELEALCTQPTSPVPYDRMVLLTQPSPRALDQQCLVLGEHWLLGESYATPSVSLP